MKAHLKAALAASLFCVLTVLVPLGSFAQAPRAQGSAQPTAADRALAGDEFRRGVQAYYRGAFNDAVMIFEKALSYIPGEPLILDWLGKAYFRSGIEGAALQQWQFAADAGFGGVLLRNRMEVVRERRTVRAAFDEDARYVESGQILSKNESITLFRQPVSAAAVSDGSVWVTAYGSNELVHFDVNGIIVGRTRGPLAGFDRPFDLIRLEDGRMLVSETAADRVSVLSPDGNFLFSFGKKGRGNGEFIGPQFLAVDGTGNIYVTDYGNSRVVVFDPDGKPLFTFGSKSPYFRGFKAPGGIAFLDGSLYVADPIEGSLHVFDTAGNFRETLLPEGSIRQCESIRVWKGSLLVSLPSRVLMVDPQMGGGQDLVRLGNAPMRIMGAVPDANGNLVLMDYKGNLVQMTTRMSELVGGMFVQIQRVNADKFPEVVLEVRVEDRDRNPIVGLKGHNFLITEEKRPVSKMELSGAGYLDGDCDITVLIERSPSSDRRMGDIRNAIADIASAMGGKGTLRIVSAGAVPVQEGMGPPDTGAWSAFRPKSPASTGWKFDMGLRLAANDLVNASRKRAVVFLSTGEIGAQGFGRYSLNDLSAYMGNNGILFSVVYLDRSSAPAEYEYLTRSTGGDSWYLYRNEGLAKAVERIRNSPNGVYLLRYTSVLPTDFGKAYLPVEIEAYLMNRSGRDESGYFAPLE